MDRLAAQKACFLGQIGPQRTCFLGQIAPQRAYIHGQIVRTKGMFSWTDWLQKGHVFMDRLAAQRACFHGQIGCTNALCISTGLCDFASQYQDSSWSTAGIVITPKELNSTRFCMEVSLPSLYDSL